MDVEVIHIDPDRVAGSETGLPTSPEVREPESTKLGMM
jgi:hypothetical protein